MNRGMDIIWGTKEKHLAEMETLFLELGKEGLMYNHYDFAKIYPGGFSQQEWKDFLEDGRVQEYIESEFGAIQTTELRKMIMDINDSNSVGKAQLINSMTKILEGKDDIAKRGPAFIYCYVPPDIDQAHADDVIILNHDPFKTT